MSSFSVIVKLTYACPLKCNYCYNGNTLVSSSAFSVSQIRRLVNETIGYAKGRGFADVEYIWMGGEPLLLPAEIFEEIASSQQELGDGIEISNYLQTSGIASDTRLEVIERLASLGFHFSVSLDGPEEIHDQQRKTKKGNGSHSAAIRTYELIKSTGAPVGAIAVLTRASCLAIDSFYDFFSTNSIQFSFLAPYRAGYALENDSTVPTSAQLSSALISLFDRWFDANDDYVYCSTMSSMLSSVIHGTPKGCAGSRNCSLRTISVDPDGNCYPCPSFPRDDKYCYGSIFSEDLGDLLSSKNALKVFARDSEKLGACANCEYREICNGGCPSSALSANGTIHSADGNCQSYCSLFAHMKSRLAQEVSIRKHTSEKGMQLQITSRNRPVVPNQSLHRTCAKSRAGR